MQLKRRFLEDLYEWKQRRVWKVPFLDHFKNDRGLRKELFGLYEEDNVKIEKLAVFNTLADIQNDIDQFQKSWTGLVVENKILFAESFVKNIIRKLESLRIPKLTESILTEFLNNDENLDIVVEDIVGFNDSAFYREHGLTLNEANRKYGEIKRYANNSIEEYLKQNKVVSTAELNWNGTNIEFLELVKALIESRAINGSSQKEVISKLSKVFGINIKNPDKQLSDLRKRNNGSETLFLDKLKEALYDHIAK